MRIDGNGSIPNQIAAERSEKAEQKARVRQSDAERSKLPADTVAMSSLQARAMETPPIRYERVQAVRNAVQNGDYRMEASETAEGMMKEMGEQ